MSGREAKHHKCSPTPTALSSYPLANLKSTEQHPRMQAFSRLLGIGDWKWT